MKCDEFTQLFLAYLDDELALEELRSMELHLAECRQCQNEVESLRATRKQLHQALRLKAADIALSPELWSKIEQRVKGDKQPESSRIIRSKSKFAGGLKMLKELMFRQPKWRTATVGMLLLALIVALSITIPLLGGDSNIALAAEQIARDSETFGFVTRGEGDLTLIEVVEQDDDQATVTFATETGKHMTFHVDLNLKKVIEINKWIGINDGGYRPEDKMEKPEAIRIARTDPMVQEFMAEGPVIELAGQFGPDHEWIVHFFPGDIKEQPVRGGKYVLEGLGVRVDIEKQEIIAVNKGTTGVSIVQIEYELAEADREEAIDIVMDNPTGTGLIGQGYVVESVKRLPADFQRLVDVILMLEEQTIVQGQSFRVDLDKKEITDIDELVMVEIPVSVVQIGIELNKIEKEEGIQIANDDPRVQELLSEGFAFEEVVHASHTSGERSMSLWLMPKDKKGRSVLTEDGLYRLDGYCVQVDLGEGKVVSIGDLTKFLSPDDLEQE